MHRDDVRDRRVSCWIVADIARFPSVQLRRSSLGNKFLGVRVPAPETWKGLLGLTEGELQPQLGELVGRSLTAS